MATTAAIGMKQADGSVKAVYLHWDGYPGYAGAILGGWYKTPEQVAALIKLGNLSQIGAKLAPAPGRPHNMAKPQDDVVLAYHRDCGERLQRPTRFASVEEYRQNGKAQLSAEYLYLFDDGKWNVYGLYGISEWVELNVVLGTIGKEVK